MPRFDPDRIARLVSEMRKATGRLGRLRALDKEALLQDPDKIGSAKYHFIVSIEAAIDICNHVISKNGYRVPEDYADSFQVVGEQGAFEVEFTKDLKEMARFRNRLVRLHWEIDDDQLYGILQTRMEDSKRFLDRIARFLDLPNS
jgi:uncharacterized protein YutE (UPF0331/DUF86 family)